jgi:hypothetical protein
LKCVKKPSPDIEKFTEIKEGEMDLKEGIKAPDFILKDSQGNDMALTQVSLVNFSCN